MQNEGTDFPNRKKQSAKSCCLLALIIGFACFSLALTAAAGIIIVDSVCLKGEDFTLSRRVERYKVAAQFIWADFRDWVSRQFSNEPPAENDPFF